MTSIWRGAVLCFVWLLPVCMGPHVEATEGETTADKPLAIAGSPSMDDLITRFLAALEMKDASALHELRVTKDEYLDVIVPYTVDPGKPPRQISEQPKQYFWQVLDHKSRLFANVLFERFGGRHFVERQLRLTEQPRKYAGYTAHGEVRMDLKDEAGTVHHLSTGWIADVSGQYKFIGFEWDD